MFKRFSCTAPTDQKVVATYCSQGEVPSVLEKVSETVRSHQLSGYSSNAPLRAAPRKLSSEESPCKSLAICTVGMDLAIRITCKRSKGLPSWFVKGRVIGAHGIVNQLGWENKGQATEGYLWQSGSGGFIRDSFNQDSTGKFVKCFLHTDSAG